MSEQLKESLSAALDDAADEFELRRVLDETRRSDALHDTFGRYQLVKSVLRGEASAQTLRYRHELQRRMRASFEEGTPADQQDETAAEPIEAAPVASRRSVRFGVAAVALIAVLAAVFVSFDPATTVDGSLIVQHSDAPLDTTVVSADVVSADGVSASPDNPLDATAPASAAQPEITPDGVVDRHRQYLERHRSDAHPGKGSP